MKNQSQTNSILFQNNFETFYTNTMHVLDSQKPALFYIHNRQKKTLPLDCILMSNLWFSKQVKLSSVKIAPLEAIILLLLPLLVENYF